METPEEFVGSNHQIHHPIHHLPVIKPRRNKRLRLLTSSGVLAADATSSSSCGGGGGDQEYLAAASSSVSGDVSTEEEEDMANCLILLAQGGRPTTQALQQGLKIDRVSSKRFNFETMAKSGFYVYECKTCNRTFPSFQALGGHRASHKKPKPITAVAPEEGVSELEPQFNNKIAAPVAAVVVQIPATKTVAAVNCQAQKGGKVHECSICGLEFSSGQALGGHMRRHRATAAVSSTTTQQQVVAMNSAVKGTTTTTMKQRNNILELDLNLPAPEEDLRETKFQFTATPQPIVFSAPTLVDCHY